MTEILKPLREGSRCALEEFGVIGFALPPLHGPGQLSSHAALPSCCSEASGPALRGNSAAGAQSAGWAEVAERMQQGS
ncbi:hypothetical protein PFLUV_G00112270 [Perca fluviatilis]|uniref:Uncharacterized protein n=1 Tax=Perca fluviatilis TaxID=8168 RepID=A0A6A5F969_PERFL|nr:hypothetical protein PFLUV_G00112270 [Perca fluviatilis]